MRPMEPMPTTPARRDRLSYRLPATGYRLRATGYGLPATGYRLRATGYGLRATGYRLPRMSDNWQGRGCSLIPSVPMVARAWSLAYPQDAAGRGQSRSAGADAGGVVQTDKTRPGPLGRGQPGFDGWPLPALPGLPPPCRIGELSDPDVLRDRLPLDFARGKPATGAAVRPQRPFELPQREVSAGFPSVSG